MYRLNRILHPTGLQNNSPTTLANEIFVGCVRIVSPSTIGSSKVTTAQLQELYVALPCKGLEVFGHEDLRAMTTASHAPSLNANEA